MRTNKTKAKLQEGGMVFAAARIAPPLHSSAVQSYGETKSVRGGCPVSAAPAMSLPKNLNAYQEVTPNPTLDLTGRKRVYSQKTQP